MSSIRKCSLEVDKWVTARALLWALLILSNSLSQPRIAKILCLNPVPPGFQQTYFNTLWDSKYTYLIDYYFIIIKNLHI